MRLSVFPAAISLLVLLCGCAEQTAGPGAAGHPNLIIVREFAAAPGAVALDPSLGFSLDRGSAGVSPHRRAESVARGAAFNLADRVAQQLSALGFDVVRSNTATAEPGGRALIVGGAFRQINEGIRHQNGSIAVEVEVDSQAGAGPPRRLASFPLDSRRLPREPVTGVSARQGNDVELAAARVAATLARYVAELARLNSWSRRR